MSFMRSTCPFCKTEANQWSIPNTSGYFGYDCKICKCFCISYPAIQKLQNISDGYYILNCISENIKANTTEGPIVTSWHLESETIGNKIPTETTVKRIEHFLSLPINHADKSIDILLHCSNKLENNHPFKDIEFNIKDQFYLKIIDSNELRTWLKNLEDDNLIKIKTFDGTISVFPFDPLLSISRISITPLGWEKIYEKRQSLSSKNVFIAMQFNWGEDLESIKNKFINALKEGCRDCGFEANIVSEHHTGPIMDKIISEIKSSKFVIADFTFNNRGAYFEAGYARALGIPVIHTVMDGHTDDNEDESKRLHFDIQQINYIKWSDPKEVREKIRDRINAIIK